MKKRRIKDFFDSLIETPKPGAQEEEPPLDVEEQEWLAKQAAKGGDARRTEVKNQETC